MEQTMSDTEHQIMKIIWAHAPEPVRFAAIMEELARDGRVCRTNTLITFLGRLQKKGFLRTRKVGRLNEYIAVVDGDAYCADQARGFLDKYYEGSVSGLVTSLIQAEMLTSDEYDELRRALLGNER